MISEEPESDGYEYDEKKVIEIEDKTIGKNSRKEKYGLALSGGGIRSAAFSLGVIQVLDKNKKFTLFDYLSTVSGGGYIGVSLVWWLYQFKKKYNNEDVKSNTFPFSEVSKWGKNILNYLRAHTNYLLPTPSLNKISFAAVVVRMTIVSLLVYISIIATTVTIISKFLSSILDFLNNAYDKLNNNYISGSFIPQVDMWIRNLFENYWYFMPKPLFVVLSILFLFLYWLKVITNSSNSPLGSGEQFFLKIFKTGHKLIESLVFVSPIFIVPIESFHRYLSNILFKEIVEIELYLVNKLLIADIFLWSLFVIGCFTYSILTVVYQTINKYFKTNEWDNFRYKLRIESQSRFGIVLLSSLVLPLLILLVYYMGWIIQEFPSNIWAIPSLFLTLLVLGSVITVSFAIFNKSTNKTLTTLIPTIGAIIFLSGIVVGIVQFIKFFSILVDNYVYVITNSSDLSVPVPILVLVPFLIVAIFVSAYFVNINFLGIHRMYRDRLMELFLPSFETISNYSWQPAETANTTMLHEINCVKRPYLLINTNVVLVDSDDPKYRHRGGDNFIFSTQYCGSTATGWIPSKQYSQKAEKGFTLATAMAISGAVANPNTGDKGVTRNRLVSIVMSILGWRVGYWAPNPKPGVSRSAPPSFLSPGVDLVLFNKCKESSHSIDLTDGGHFENLGLYELIRRKLNFIVVVDSTRDPEHEFSDLANAINLVQVDFGARIHFDNKDFSLEQLRHKTSKSGIDDHIFAEHGFALANIEYDCGATGKLFYIKPTLTSNLPVEILSYKAHDVKFPHQTTTDQFFDEQQFDSYRKLGYHLVTDMLNKVKL